MKPEGSKARPRLRMQFRVLRPPSTIYSARGETECRLKIFTSRGLVCHVIISVARSSLCAIARSSLCARVAARARAARAAAATPPLSCAPVSALDCACAARPWLPPRSPTQFAEYRSLARATCIAAMPRRDGGGGAAQSLQSTFSTSAPVRRRLRCAAPQPTSPNGAARRLRLGRFAVARP